MVGYYLLITTLFILIIQNGRKPDCSIKLSIRTYKEAQIVCYKLKFRRHENYRILRMLVILLLKKKNIQEIILFSEVLSISGFHSPFIFVLLQSDL